MPQRTPTRPRTTLFRKSCLATAIAALTALPSACSTMPAGGDVAPDDTLVEAGLDEHDLGERNWSRVMYLLGFSEEAKRASRAAAGERERRGVPTDELSPGDGVLLDEVDWALMEEDAPMPASFPDVAESAADPEPVVVVVSAEEETALAEGTLAANAPAGESAIGAEALQVGSRALSHTVDDSETLWDIAKATTGDATNWHVLADVNDLAPDAAVYPGQVLTIPADLVRPERLAESTATADPSVPAGAADSLSPDGEPLALAAAPPGSDFELEAGETLWDLAKRATGDATNWRAIAEANGFTDRDASRVRPGQTITVPLALVSEAPVTDAVGSDGTGAVADAAASAVPAAGGGEAAEGTETVQLPDVDATGPLEPIPSGPLSNEVVRAEPVADAPRARAKNAGDDALQIVDAAYRRGAAEREASALPSDLPSKIMVSGTYYPKAVYHDADFSSSLLMRVSPGTTLQVSRALGPWFEVQTEQGKGYVHTRDIK